MCSDKIELRSEKVRNIVGEVPNAINRTGIILVVMLLCIIAMIFSTIYYPISISAKLESITIDDEFYYVKLYIPNKYFSRVKKGDKIRLVDENQLNSPQTYAGEIICVNDIDSNSNSNEADYCSLNAKFDLRLNISSSRTNNTVKIILQNNNLLKHLLNR